MKPEIIGKVFGRFSREKPGKGNQAFGLQLPPELDPDDFKIVILHTNRAGKTRIVPTEDQENLTGGKLTSDTVPYALAQGEVVPAKIDGQKEGDAVSVTYVGRNKSNGNMLSSNVLYTLKDGRWVGAQKTDNTHAEIRFSKKL